MSFHDRQNKRFGAPCGLPWSEHRSGCPDEQLDTELRARPAGRVLDEEDLAWQAQAEQGEVPWS